MPGLEWQDLVALDDKGAQCQALTKYDNKL